jgi:hypothetical protein
MLKKLKIFIITVLCVLPAAANAQKLPPASFNDMYVAASQGKIGILKDAVYRGMDINAVNENGDTGLCMAIRRWDYRAYNSFRAAGAAPQTYCTGTIPREQYEDFMSSSHIPEFFKYEQNAFYAPTGQTNSSFWGWIIGGAIVAAILVVAL